MQRRRWVSSTRNAHGVETHQHGSPTSVQALGFAPEQSTEPREAGSARVVIPATLYLSAAQETDPRDLWVVRGRTYAAEGESGEWVSPYSGRKPGQVVTLRSVIG